MIGLEPYKDRRIDFAADAYVYRNLMRTDGAWYSVMQRGLVVAHAREVAIAPARFVVREAGRRRTLASGIKCVHAFVVGRVLREPAPDLEVRGRYRPAEPHFVACLPKECYVSSAGRAHLNARGLWLDEPIAGVVRGKLDTLAASTCVHAPARAPRSSR